VAGYDSFPPPPEPIFWASTNRDGIVSDSETQAKRESDKAKNDLLDIRLILLKV
jgi:hypothetical protein